MLRTMMTLLFAFFGLIAGPNEALAQSATQRHALVIGNDNYRHVERLQNSRSDARAVASALEQSGFRVNVHTDLDLNGLKGVLRTFKAQVNGGDEAVFFFAGHGVEIEGVSYLMPTDIKGDTPDQVRDDAVPLQRVLDDLREKRARFSLAIIDACRNNPFQSTQVFASRLSQRTGRRYRLPSEAEWEYAARAGSTTPYHFGSDASRLGEYAWIAFNSRLSTQPVGRLKANAFGLHDMLGNVWEWTEDCWNGSYAGAPTDGRAWTQGDCGKRVLRGGSWKLPPTVVRTAYRFAAVIADESVVIGFRVARTD
jgi:hypothetical protein